MKRQTKKSKQRKTRLSKKRKSRSFSRRRRQRGGAELPVPEGSVVGVNLDPKDAYSVPVLVSKAKYENEVLEN